MSENKDEEMTPAERWEKIKEIAETLRVQVQDLQDYINNPFKV